jgi:hypothetical protein
MGPTCRSADTSLGEGYDVGPVSFPCSINSVDMMFMGAELSREASFIRVPGQVVGIVALSCQKNDVAGDLRERAMLGVISFSSRC